MNHLRSWAVLPILVVQFARRDLAIARSYRLPYLAQLVAGAGILLVVNRVSRLVDPGRSDDPALAAGFFSYVLLGMAVLAVVGSAVVSFSSKLRQEQVSGTLEALLSTPAPPAALALAMSTYELAQGLLGAVLLVAVGLPLGLDLSLSAVGLATALSCLAGLLATAAAVGVMVAAATVVLQRGGAVAGLGVAVIALLSGVYFPIGELPGMLRVPASLSPFTWGLSGLRRGLLLGESDPVHTAGVLVAGAVLLPVSLLLFVCAVDLARRRGTLGQF